MPSHPDPFPRPTLQLPHTTATHPAAGATGLAGRGTFQLHSYGNNNNNISVNNKAASNDQGLNVPGGGRERPGAGPAPFQSTMMVRVRGGRQPREATHLCCCVCVCACPRLRCLLFPTLYHCNLCAVASY
eukprot:scaffold30549_cov22-Tisochrysis_lutea.AAC.2